MRLLLARHGQSVWNEIRRFQGATDVGLSALGRAQAAALGRAVRGYRVVAAYVSPMRRALETTRSAEVRLRLRSLLGLLDRPTAEQRRLRHLRARAALEYAGTTEARRLLEALQGK